jgi:hypothetical protein
MAAFGDARDYKYRWEEIIVGDSFDPPLNFWGVIWILAV